MSQHAPVLTRRGVLRAAAAVTATSALVACGKNDDQAADGVVEVELWHGQVDTGKAAIDALINEFNRTHPNIRVNGGGGGVTADSMLQKVTAGLAAGSFPDIAYIFGSDLASLTRSPKVADLSGALNLGDFWPAAQESVTVKGKVRAAPALLDSLCLVYNKKLFAAAGLSAPKPGWTWDDFITTAKALTNPGKGVFGTGWPGVGDEDTVWRLWPMIWDLGGDVASQDGKKVAFDQVGAQALGTLDRLRTDKSLYVDLKPGSEQLYQVFLGGRMGMVATGPWQLPDLAAKGLDYGVVPLPTYSGKPVTISGPDTWTVFDNGKAKVKAASEFVNWLIQPQQDIKWDVEGGSLPLSKGTAASPAWTKHSGETPGLKVFVDALETARVRPTISAYPKISQALGEAIVSVLLGKKSPDDAIKQAVDVSNAVLAVPS
ncbi:ABC transporter substrate-binding protein [Kribbella antibiotica]|uniref:ABC transporter substrate-binding protein n=1 Tax=Kribbella antibiotica TaxID=190195 RepID=A0A4R4YRX6_9ACTN|nr:ABC transporter substrate-binding protein [Kribbella antibiotica]TDD48035.1 ABC transporter substrate-binding protein [Kribbella antibiotica]